MTLQYLNGQIVEAVLLSRTDLVMRVIPKGFDDVVELQSVNGVWVSDDCEPVVVKFEWEGRATATFSEEDFICPPELADRLVNMLLTADEPETGSAPKARAAGSAASAHTRRN